MALSPYVLGLLSLCGTKGRGIGHKLKKSSYYALRILLKFLEESGKEYEVQYDLIIDKDQKEDFITFFTDLEDDEFPMLKLAQHINLVDQTNDETSLYICKIIYVISICIESSHFPKGKKKILES